MTMRPLIYLVTNRLDGKRYVGLTRFTLEKRWAEHCYCALRRQTRSWLHRAIAKHGAEAFDIVQIASCLSAGVAAKVDPQNGIT